MNKNLIEQLKDKFFNPADCVDYLDNIAFHNSTKSQSHFDKFGTIKIIDSSTEYLPESYYIDKTLYYFVDIDTYLLVLHEGNSYETDDSTWKWEDFKIVKPVEKTIIVYEPI